MVPVALEKLAKLCQTFCGDKPANKSSRNGDPTSTRTHPKKIKGVGIKNNKGDSYFQYKVKLVSAEVKLPQEPFLAPLP